MQDLRWRLIGASPHLVVVETKLPRSFFNDALCLVGPAHFSHLFALIRQICSFSIARLPAPLSVSIPFTERLWRNPILGTIQKVRQEQGQRQGKEQKQEQVRSSSECSQSKFGTLPHLFPMISIGEGSNQTPEVKHEKGTKLRPGTLYVYIYI